MNIYFTAAVRGGRAHETEYAQIVGLLEKYGAVLSGHVADEALSHFGETRLSYTQILERELSALEKSDIVVAEVTTPALGVGYMIGRATNAGKRVIALHFGEFDLKLSSIVQGDRGIEVYSYQTSDDLEKILNETLGR